MVKLIFKVLVGTIGVIITASLIVELINVTTASHMITQMTDKAVEAACDYFSQETYKTNKVGIRGNMNSLVGTGSGDGGYSGGVVSGAFYIGGSAEDVYNNLYRSSSSFSSFVDQFSSTWQALKDVKDGTNDLINDNLITPANMGVTYLDIPTLERIARWNIAKILCGGRMGNVRGNGLETYVTYNGFDVYANQLKITEVTYRKVKMDTSEFKEITHMDYTKLGVDMTDNERANICVASIKFSVPIKYNGVTPIKSIIAMFANNKLRVQGMDSEVRDPENHFSIYNDTAVGNYEGGGVDGSSIRPTTGSITYYIIR